MSQLADVLTRDERAILDVVAGHELSSTGGLAMNMNALLLEFPAGGAPAVSARVQTLLARGLLDARSWTIGRVLKLTPPGLLNSSFCGEAASLAEGVLRYISNRLELEKSTFREYTWEDLKAADVVGGDAEFRRATMIISLFNLMNGGSWSGGPPPSARWSVPADGAALREIKNIDGLQERVRALSSAVEGEAGEAMTATASPPAQTERRYGRWVRGIHLDSGGQGTAFLARNVATDQVGALKLLHDDPSQNAAQKAKARARFKHELRASQKVQHPCVLRVFDANVEDVEAWVVTEFMPLGSLQRSLRALRGDAWRCLRLARDVASALAEAHSAGVIHRDVKPRNVLLRALDHAVVGDFGIAHISDATQLTGTDEKVGAQWFRPPEADEGRIEQPSPSFDVYSLGKVIYTSLTGGERFRRERFRNDSANLAAILQRPELECVNRLLDRMIVEDAAGRFQKMDEVIRGIDIVIGELFGIGPADQCRVCRRGKYETAPHGSFQVDGRISLVVWEGNDGGAPIVEICHVCGDIRLSAPKRRKHWSARS